MKGWITTMGFLVVVGACAPVSPCDEYVDYMCACHPDYDCDTLALTYDGAEPSLQDECAVLLDEVEDADREAGTECPSE